MWTQLCGKGQLDDLEMWRHWHWASPRAFETACEQQYSVLVRTGVATEADNMSPS